MRRRGPIGGRHSEQVAYAAIRASGASTARTRGSAACRARSSTTPRAAAATARSRTSTSRSRRRWGSSRASHPERLNPDARARDPRTFGLRSSTSGTTCTACACPRATACPAPTWPRATCSSSTRAARHDLGRRAQRVERHDHTRRCHLGRLELRHRRHAAVSRDRARGPLLPHGLAHRVVRLRHGGARRGHRGRAPLRDLPPQRHRDRARAGGDRAVRTATRSTCAPAGTCCGRRTSSRR